ncbi:MAG: tetratricopeptide repeat protein [Acidobacteria bacterium]|nr:tetratricopeptide repeat protein [Acidobacteriota bacterium]MBI3663082.1 tetratricopeptide repeat protein [Acidobacteriota bacterium]
MSHIRRLSAVLVFAASLVFLPPSLLAQQPPSAPRKAAEKAASPSEVENRAEAYFNFAMGNYYEELYEGTSRSDHASLSIEHYKKAYALDPRASVIRERLAGIYAKSQRIRDAVLEAQEILTREPDNLAARRLLARIYVHTLGERSTPSGSKETVARAIEQYREIQRLDPADTDATLWLARLYRFQNDLPKAEEVLRAGLAQEPENEELLRQFTLLLLDQGRADEVIALLGKIADRSPSSELLALLGDAYVRMQEHARAEGAFSRAVELDPREPEYRRKLAQALLAQGKAEAALTQYQSLTEIEPAAVQNYLRIAEIYRQLKKLDRAEESLLRAKQRAPGSLEVIYSEALLYEAQGRLDDAIRVLTDSVAAVKVNPGSLADSRRTLSVLYEQLGRLNREAENFTSAIDAYREMLRLDTENEKRARSLIADTYRLAKDMSRALEESHKGIEMFPQDRGLQVTHALMLGENGQTDEAAKLLRSMLAQSSGDRDIYITLAQVYERGKRFDDAEQAARMAEQLAASPAENEGVWFLLGAIFERRKKFGLAEEQFKKVLHVNPQNAQVLNYFGYMLADQGVRLEEAADMIQRALTEEPFNGAYLDSLGWAYFRQNKMAEAEAYLRKAIERNRFDPAIHDHLGDVLAKSGRAAQAATEWETALAEWQRALPTELDPDRVAALEKKLAGLKHRIAQKSSSEPKPK